MRKSEVWLVGWALLGGFAALMLLTLGCRSMRVTGYGSKSSALVKTQPPQPEDFEVQTATRPVRRRPENYNLPEVSTAAAELTKYYSDLGPDEIDVSSYPARQRHNYAVFKTACSQCHSLARSINVPVVSRRYWELYITGMRFNAYFSRDKKLEKDDLEAVLDFLEYDSNERKREHRAEFEALQDELKRRYGAILAERIRRMQHGRQPVILRGDQP